MTDEEDQLDFLNIEYPCLYFFVCLVREISCQEFMDICKALENHENTKLYVYHIHGWWFPHLAQLRTQGKLKQGTTEVKIYGYSCKYTGELN